MGMYLFNTNIVVDLLFLNLYILCTVCVYNSTYYLPYCFLIETNNQIGMNKIIWMYQTRYQINKTMLKKTCIGCCTIFFHISYCMILAHVIMACMILWPVWFCGMRHFVACRILFARIMFSGILDSHSSILSWIQKRSCYRKWCYSELCYMKRCYWERNIAGSCAKTFLVTQFPTISAQYYLETYGQLQTWYVSKVSQFC